MLSVFAPGKVLISGAYAVLEGAPAIVAAVDRGAIAQGDRSADRVIDEVTAALGTSAPYVSADAMFDNGRKLGLGASAALTVAAVALRDAERGVDVSTEDAREAIFTRSLRAHQQVQRGGSGVDVAASVHGGVLDYRIDQGRQLITKASWPKELVLQVFAANQSARTTELRAKVDALRSRDAALFEKVMWPQFDAAARASAALSKGDVGRFLSALSDSAEALRVLGAAADAPIVLSGHEALFSAAVEEGGAFFPSGAGGGDISVFIGRRAPSGAFLSRAAQVNLLPLSLCIDPIGVRAVERRGAS